MLCNVKNCALGMSVLAAATAALYYTVPVVQTTLNSVASTVASVAGPFFSSGANFAAGLLTSALAWSATNSVLASGIAIGATGMAGIGLIILLTCCNRNANNPVRGPQKV